MKTEYDEVKTILDRHDVSSLDDIEYGSEVYEDLFGYYMDSGEMPYGVMKARTGMPDEWIVDRIYDLGLLNDEKDKDVKMPFPDALDQHQIMKKGIVR
jgi:hypothetical protein|tara:strand:- start:951 stop:1244 length:294 start_codon:yes stop_codon:yes gene_type:complete